jgi:hypothetical protein
MYNNFLDILCYKDYSLVEMPEAFRFQEPLEALQAELKKAVSQREELERRISGLRQSISGLLRLRDASFDEDEPPEGYRPNPLFKASASIPDFIESLVEVTGGSPPKLAEACRSSLRSAFVPMTAGELRRELETMGFDFSKYASNPLSAIYTTLKRDRLVRAFKNERGKTVFEYNHSEPAPNSLAKLSGPSPSGPTEALKQFENNPLKGKKINE